VGISVQAMKQYHTEHEQVFLDKYHELTALRGKFNGKSSHSQYAKERIDACYKPKVNGSKTTKELKDDEDEFGERIYTTAVIKELEGERKVIEKARRSLDRLLLQGWRPNDEFEEKLRAKMKEQWKWLKPDCVEVAYPDFVDQRDVEKNINMSMIKLPTAKAELIAIEKRIVFAESKLCIKGVQKSELNKILVWNGQIKQVSERSE